VPKLKRKQLVRITWGLFIIALLATTIYLWFENQQLKRAEALETNAIFQDFVHSELPTLLVVGDYYFYHIKNFAYSDISRLTRINSETDFDAFIEENPGATEFMEKVDNSYFGQDVAYGMPQILYQLHGIRSRLKIRLASKLNYNDLRENNIIYIGSLKAIGIVRNLMTDMRIQYGLTPSRIFMTNAEGDTTDVYSLISSFPDHFEWTDYAIAAKFPGRNKNTILIISTFNSWDSGTTAKNLTDRQSIENIKNQFVPEAEFPRYFEILFEVNGYRRTSLNAKPVYFFIK
jgi:hypothetical protein